MGCDKGAVEKMNRKVNSLTSLFLFHLLAEQLSLKSHCPPQFFALLHFRREGIEEKWEAGGEETKREEKRRTATHLCVFLCVRGFDHTKSTHRHAHISESMQQRSQ